MFATAAQYHFGPQGSDFEAVCRHTLTASLKKRGSGSVLGSTLIRTTDEELEALFSDFDQARTQFIASDIFGIDRAILPRVYHLFGVAQEMMRTRRFFVTGDKCMGFAPGIAQKDDRIAIMCGCSTPFMIRETDTGDWKLVGDCYVHGLMDGEVIQMDDVPATDIRLV